MSLSVAVTEWTGNETQITARFMRTDDFNFWPVGKLLFVGNHRPSFGDVTPAIARRLRLIEFTNKPKTVDDTLKDRLKAEWPAILRWMMDGYKDYAANGLQPPHCVLQASSDYLKEENVVDAMIEEWTEKGSGYVLLRRDAARAMEVFRKVNGYTKKTKVSAVYKALREGHKAEETRPTPFRVPT